MFDLETNLKTRDLDHITLKSRPRPQAQGRDRDYTETKILCEQCNIV